jgi:antitoxin ParD1/3/4
MDVSLTDALERYVREQVARGDYADASEVIREALRLKMAVDRREAAKLEALRAAIDEAEASIEAERLVDYTPELLDEIEREAVAERRAAG